jgi:hypothetical protein
MKSRESKMRRAQRGQRSSQMTQQEEEKAFTLGLLDCCPRCGESFEGYPDEDQQRQHLVDCMDDKKHAEFKAHRIEQVLDPPYRPTGFRPPPLSPEVTASNTNENASPLCAAKSQAGERRQGEQAAVCSEQSRLGPSWWTDTPGTQPSLKH